MITNDLPFALSEDGKTFFMTLNNEIETIDLPKGIEVIDCHAFSACMKLVDVVIPEGVKKISDFAFEGCSSLHRIWLPSSLSYIGSNCFDGCLHLKSIEVNPSSTCFVSMDGVLFNREKTVLLIYPADRNETTFMVPEGVELIGVGAFSNAVWLKEVMIPASVKEIGDEAFYLSNLSSVKMMEGVERVGDFSFFCCKSLEEVHVPETASCIGGYAFSGCVSLKTAVLSGKDMTVSSHAFSKCANLRTVILSSSVKQIEELVFDECPLLSDIHCHVKDPSGIIVDILDSENAIQKRCTLHVPGESVQLYREHPVFGDFENIEPFIDE